MDSIENSQDNLPLWIALGKVSNIGPVLIKRLLDKFKSPEAVFGASESELLAIEGLGEKIARQILHGPDMEYAESQIDTVQKKGFRIVTRHSSEYPARLKEIYDPPFLLYVRGQIEDSDSRAIAVIGSRRATHYGKKVAEIISEQLVSSGVTVVSGLARGIDSAAHRAALKQQGRTLAVLGCGLDVIYPAENASLYRDIESSGAVISELPCGTPPEGQNFPRRNRIISGLSLGVVVVEASFRSGAFVTARHALEQNREVFAVPGNITSTTSSGTNYLIKQGASLVTSAEDVLSELEFIMPGADSRESLPIVTLEANQVKLFEELDDEPMHIDAISRKSGVGVPQLLGILLDMELKGAVTQISGKRFVKSNVKLYNGSTS